jgi:integrase/recombinase XerD
MTKPISPLRQRMIDDMTMRNLSANTQETYIRSVAQFSAFHRRCAWPLSVLQLTHVSSEMCYFCLWS